MPRLKKQKIDPKLSTDMLIELRRDAAEEVCYTLLIMMRVGMLNLPKEEREYLGKHMSVWSDLEFFISDREQAAAA